MELTTQMVKKVYGIINEIMLKTSGSFWKYQQDEPALNNSGSVIDFPADGNNRALFEFETKIAGTIDNDGTKDVIITMVPLKYLSNF